MIKKPASFVTTVDTSIASKLIRDLQNQDFTITKPQYTVFSAKKKGVSCTLYESGKLMVQGKDKDAFIEFYLEPEVLGDFSYTYGSHDVDKSARIGIDESGKGDFFGPLCVAGVFAEGDAVTELQELGVRDSKKIGDAEIIEIGKKIKKKYAHHIVKINPKKYNELYAKFGNLNHLLAWGHATVIEHMHEKTHCKKVIVDQFAAKSVVETALKRKSLQLDLHQRHRAEEDLIVAAASILARMTFLEGLAKLEDEFVCKLPKGASQAVVQSGKDFVKKYGKEMLEQVAKTHFKTLDAIVISRTQ